MVRYLLIGLGALSVAALPTVSLALDDSAYARPMRPAEKRYIPYSGQMPTCGDLSILRAISSRFAEREADTVQSGVVITGFDHIAETGFRSAGMDLIPRRFCSARAQLNTGKPRNVSYMIGESTGWLGIGDGLEWCVEGFDRGYAHGGDCSALKP